jgi:diguanylate cyclase (GGDEF)-like protein
MTTKRRAKGDPERRDRFSVPGGIRSKFFLVLMVLVPCLLAVAWVGIAAQRRASAEAHDLYAHNLTEAQHLANVASDISSVGRLGLEVLMENRATELAEQRVRLYDQAVPAVEAQIGSLNGDHASAEDVRQGDVIEQDWRQLADILSSQAFRSAVQNGAPTAAREGLAQRLAGKLESLSSSLSDMQAAQAEEAKSAIERVERDADRTLWLVVAIVTVATLAGVCSVLLLIRNVVPRVRAYSRFAAEVAAGELTGRMNASGSDELSELGRTLNAMVDRRADDLRYQRTQSELNEAMQVTQHEEEAHQLLKRHLERNIPGAVATVLNRNNSANRLQPTTPAADGCDIGERLRDAEPRACLAVRLARPHVSQPDDDGLMPCRICHGNGVASRCEPLLVGGEVIGSVLVQHPGATNAEHGRRVSESVTLAAPVLANLRNLALAEHRALNDALTGVPNQRACHDTLRRMVAQASRSVTPLAAVLLDLDHFKQLNDVFGHDRGDEALAAVGAVLTSSIRASDFAGRYGGEEFLLLLPETDKAGALGVAESIRLSIGGIKIAGITTPISASFGVAVLPDDAGDPEGLVRQADRALYSAKAAGRNQVQGVRHSDDITAEKAPAS